MSATDLLAATARLIDIPSPSHDEGALADHIEAELSAVPQLEVVRVDDNVIARTAGGRRDGASADAPRVLLAGHLDTVPANGNERPRIEGDVLHGLGSADMKGGLAVMLELARTLGPAAAVDVTYLFYVCEEVDTRYSGLLAIERERPDLLDADIAILGEPTGSRVEAGCQGNLRAVLCLGGHRAHTARPLMGVNAIHRLAPVLAAVDAFVVRRPVIDGCEYREARQAVSVEGGVAPNVVPDQVRVTLNHRFAPDRDATAAFGVIRAGLEPLLDPAAGDSLELVASAEGAPPGLTHPLLADLVRRTGAEPRAKLGWTDVSFFWGRGTPATNFGPGDPELAHSAGERVGRADLERAHATLRALLTGASAPRAAPVTI